MNRGWPALGIVLIVLACPFSGHAFSQDSGEDLTVIISEASPYMTSGVDARFEVRVTSVSGKGLNAGMLDASCFNVILEDGKDLVPKREGLARQALKLGTHATISRTLNLKDLLAEQKTQTLEVHWAFDDLKAEPLTVRLYEWDLKEIEAVIRTDHGEMVLMFYPDKAPITVKNFVDLSLKGFYDGLVFHRIVKGFMIQGGCPSGDGTGNPGYTIPGEFSDLRHVRGIISMARSADPDSAGCQFFIMHKDNPGLDGSYAAFGKLTAGFDTLERIVDVEVVNQRFGNERSRPVEPPRIEKITIRPRAKK